MNPIHGYILLSSECLYQNIVKLYHQISNIDEIQISLK